MSKRSCGTSRGWGWNRIKSVSIRAFGLIVPWVIVVAAGHAEFHIDVPLANQPVVADGAIVAPVAAAMEAEQVGEPEGGIEAEQGVIVVEHRAPQESAGLGVPGTGFDTRNAEQDQDAGGESSVNLDLRRGDFLQVLGALAIVLILLFVTRFVLARVSGVAGGPRPSGVVEILARYPVARGQQLVLLKLARRILLVHQSGAEMTTLSEITDENEVAALLGRIEAGAKKDTPAFSAWFGKFAREHDQLSEQSTGLAGDSEVVDLTRKPITLRSLLSRKGVSR